MFARGTGVRLQVGVIGAEEGLRPLDADGLGLVHLGAAAVVATAGIALGVLVAQRGAERGQDRGAGEVLAGDQLQAAAQPVEFAQQDSCDLRVLGFEPAEVRTPERDVAHGFSCDEVCAPVYGEAAARPGTARPARVADATMTA